MLDSEEDKLHNTDNLQSKLRLKKCFKERIDMTHSSGSNNECKISDSSTSQPSHEDNSILDFKSPKRIHPVLQKNIRSSRLIDKSKKKVTSTKIKIVNNKKKLESSKQQNKKTSHDAQQMSIESSFFKIENNVDSPQSPANIKTAYVCPLCFKNLKDESSQAAHMKNCAIKNHMSTKKLLVAVELQERQAAERKSLGLLSAPILQDKKKPVSRKRTSHDDPDLELALALSKSLYEKEEMDEVVMLDEAGIVAASSYPLSLDDSKEFSHRTTLQSFGFTSSKSVSPTNNYSTNKTERRKLIEPTILQRRTAVERERILTERIAEILMSYKDFTQKVKEEKKPVNVKEKISMKRQLLQQLHQTENTLWDKTRLTPSRNTFYVTQLSPQITPMLKEEQKLNEEQNVENTSQTVSNKKSFDEAEKTNEVQIANINKKLAISSSTVKINCEERRYLNTLTTDWGNILNDSSASDIIVFVKNSKHIWTHKLVFYVRCTDILLDVVSNDTEFSTAKEKICWIDVDYDVALAFLEFIYCGIIDRHSEILNSDTSMSAMRFLARKYKVKDLFVYLCQEEFKSNLAKVEHNRNITEKATENANGNIDRTSSILKLSKFTSEASSNDVHNSSRNTQCIEKKLLQEHTNGISQFSTNNCIEVEDSNVPDVSYDEKTISVRLLKQMDSTSRNTSVSPDIFDDTPDIKKRNDKSMTHSKDHDDLNIHVLLSLIKQDEDADIYSQKLPSRNSDTAEHLSPGENISIYSGDIEQNIIEIDSNFHADSLKPSTDDDKSLIDTPQSSKAKTLQERLSNVVNQKGNLTLFIEKMQRANAKSDSDLDSDLDITTRPIKMSPERHLNPFCTNENNNSDNENRKFYDDNTKQSAIKSGKRLGGLSMIEQRVQSFVDKNPEFYSGFSTEAVPTVPETGQQVNTSPVRSTSSEKSCYYGTKSHSPNFTSLAEGDINITERVTSAPLSPVCSPHSKTTNELLSESISDLEADEDNVSMYSKYMKNRCDNSIAKYRSVIRRDTSDDNLPNSALSDLSNKNDDTNESDDDTALTQSVLTQKNVDVIVSDIEVENISSSVSCPAILKNDDYHEDTMFYSKQELRRMAEDNKEDLEDEGSNHSFEVEEIPNGVMMASKEKSCIVNITESKQNKFNDKETTLGKAMEFNTIFSPAKSELNELSEDKIKDRREKFTPSPIMVSSSPDSVSMKNSFLDNCDERVKATMRIDYNELSRLTGLIDFEEDICLGNVDVDRYDKYHNLKKSKSVSVLNATEFKKGGACKRTSSGNIVSNDSSTKNDASNCSNLDQNATSLAKDSTDARKFKKKYLSEGQIDIDKLHSRRAVPACSNIPFQFESNYLRKNGNVKTVPTVTDKDVTPPRDYDNMSTPELHKEMKRYGLKAQKRSRAVRLLTHIYNELHPLLPISETNVEEKVTEISSDEDEKPPLKKLNMNDNSLEKSSSTDNSEDELFLSPNSNESVNPVKSAISKEMEFYETESSQALENSSDIKEAFAKLISKDKILHNKILQYKPINIEKLYYILRANGFKCKLSNVMSFLDEQCITFYAPEQCVKSKRRKV